MNGPSHAHCRLNVPLLNSRIGQRTRLLLSRQRSVDVFNIVWGEDLGDDYEHITANVSPEVGGSGIDLFFTDEVVRVIDPISDSLLWQTDGKPNVR